MTDITKADIADAIREALNKPRYITIINKSGVPMIYRETQTERGPVLVPVR